MLGKKLKKLVQNSDKSNAEIATYLGCSVNNLYNFYKKNSLDSEVITKSCELFNVPLSYFLGEIAENIEAPKKIEVQKQSQELLKENYSLSKELIEVYRELSEFKNKLIAYQEKAFDRINNSELGKHKASSNSNTNLFISYSASAEQRAIA